MWYSELEQLIEEHLGIETQSNHNGSNWKNDCFSVIADLESNNDSKHNLGTYDDIKRWSLDEEGPLTYQYLIQLMDMGIIPKEPAVLLDVWW